MNVFALVVILATGADQESRGLLVSWVGYPQQLGDTGTVGTDLSPITGCGAWSQDIGKYEAGIVRTAALPVLPRDNRTECWLHDRRWSDSTRCANVYDNIQLDREPDDSSPHFAELFDIREAANCGDFDPIFKTYGFATAARIRQNILEHEAGALPMQSHYAFFSEAFTRPELNIGLILEGSAEKMSISDLDGAVRQRIGAAIQVILNSASVEPCGGQHNVNGFCQPTGSINYPPNYQQCPRP